MLTLRKAAIVNDAQLAQTARRLGFSELVQLGAGMRNAGGAENTSILADAFEAFVGALYLRYGLERARRFVLREHVERLEHETGALLDAKTRLQHYAQEHLGCDARLPRREPRHAAAAGLRLAASRSKGKTLGTGSGPSKKSRTAGGRRGRRCATLEAPHA